MANLRTATAKKVVYTRAERRHLIEPAPSAPVAFPLRTRAEDRWRDDGPELRAKKPEAPSRAQGRAQERDQGESSAVRWNGPRIALAQEIWGKGFVSPGGKDAVLALVGRLGLKRKMHLLELGAGLGGAARLVARRYGVWVTGLEVDDGLVEAGANLSATAWFAKKASLRAARRGGPHTPPGSYDCVFSKEFLFTVRDKVPLLRLLASLLKENGELLITDYVLAAPGQRSPAVAAWVAAERDGTRPWAVTDYVKALNALGLHLRVEDMTEQTRKAIIRGWARYLRRLDRAGLDRRTAEIVVEEAELWTRRARLLKAGDLQVCCIHATKAGGDRRLSKT